MAQIRLKRTSVTKTYGGSNTLLPGEMGIAGTTVWYGPKETSFDTAVQALSLASHQVANDFTAPISWAGDPTNDKHLTNKKYVDTQIGEAKGEAIEEAIKQATVKINHYTLASNKWTLTSLDKTHLTIGSATGSAGNANIDFNLVNVAFTDRENSFTKKQTILGGGIEVIGGARFNNDVNIAGNLTVGGTTTTVNTEQLTVEDPLILVNSGELPPQMNDIGIGFLWGDQSTSDDVANCTAIVLDKNTTTMTPVLKVKNGTYNIAENSFEETPSSYNILLAPQGDGLLYHSGNSTSVLSLKGLEVSGTTLQPIAKGEYNSDYNNRTYDLIINSTNEDKLQVQVPWWDIDVYRTRYSYKIYSPIEIVEEAGGQGTGWEPQPNTKYLKLLRANTAEDGSQYFGAVMGGRSNGGTTSRYTDGLLDVDIDCGDWA